MAKFKKGDRVRRKKKTGSFGNVKENGEYTVYSDDDFSNLKIEEDAQEYTYSSDAFELVTTPQPKFKVGDTLVQTKPGNASELTGQMITLKSIEGRRVEDTTGGWWTMEYLETNFELVTNHPQYTPLTPKAGDKFRVVKSDERFATANRWMEYKVGDICEVRRITPDIEQPLGLYLADKSDYWFISKEGVTTEYLEPINDEPLTRDDIYNRMGETASDLYYTVRESPSWTPMYGLKTFGSAEPITKPNLKTKMTNFIKKLTQSAEDKALEKAGFIDSCGDLTGRGSDALESLAFQEKKEALVKLANEWIEEQKD